MKIKYKNVFLLLLSLLLTFHILLFYGLPLKIFVLTFITITIIFFIIKGVNAFIVTISLGVGTLLFGILLKLTGLENAMYYRPQEIFSVDDNSLGHRRYQKNVHFEMQMPYGDLKGKDFFHQVVPQPRKSVFITDSLGYRNDSDYHGQKYVLVGDSFIVGNGITQPDIITEQLKTQYDIDTYNLAHPGGIEDYIKYMNSFSKFFKKENNYKFILFLFEGNDFDIHKKTETKSEYNFITHFKKAYYRKKGYYRLFNQTNIYRYTSSSINKILYSKKTKEVDKLVLDKKNLLFCYIKYKTVSERQQIITQDSAISVLEQHLGEMKEKIAYIFFIPTKYRVYYNFATNTARKKLPHQQWKYVQTIGKTLGIEVIDLTPFLIKESKQLLPQKKFTFWSDDTHWNQYGIAVAARVVAKTLNQSNRIELTH